MRRTLLPIALLTLASVCGFFAVGHDLRVSHADRKLAQTVADAMRVAALVLEAAE